ncbi:terpenoid synthase [Macrolepiota fuliginosa MF-IS2]|uniref:Terpenoid synthase n=1 Tax=Macrolepiota fuliginosa MF-IS2 TaxID=1400762 RepID=A0A9P6BY52_9AGAR|nr:terpenoid synthase [Macrolepiota fuliginosa MF-IS2]
MSSTTKSQIRDIMAEYLKQCGIAYPHEVCLDEYFRADCYTEAERRGFDMKALKKSLDTGIAIAATCYKHLDNYSTQVYIGVWTGLITYIDDNYGTYSDGLKEFFGRFTHQQPQRYQFLDQLVTMIHELPQHWGTVAANLIFTTQMDFFTASIIDSVIEGIEIKSAMAPDYPQFNRRMAGASRAYAIMSIPPELDLKSWIQVLPDYIHYTDHANDMLSFYKEELRGETLNYISLIAGSNGIAKLEALKKLANETAECYQRGCHLLESSPKALNAYRSFCVGYVGFHALDARYKLDQLNL